MGRQAANRNKIIYWTSTVLVSVMMLFSANYFINTEYRALFANLGYPQYFRIELGVAKTLGVIALILPKVPETIEEWAYAGFTFTYISAIIAHIVCEDSAFLTVSAVITFLVLTTSYTYFRKNKVAINSLV